MADSLQIRRGNQASKPTLAEGEPGYCKDTKELYIGPDKVAAANTFTRLDTLETRASNLEAKDTELSAAISGKLTASPAASVAALATDADLAAVIAAHNALLSALKAAGIMST